MSAPIVFLSGGTPGVTPWVSGRHVWGAVLERFVAPVHTLELPGTGSTAVPADGLAFDALVAAVHTRLREIGRCHLVAHDLAGLVALTIASDDPECVEKVTTIASVAAAPTGDSVENLTFAHPPAPRWGRASQQWALERIAYGPVDRSLVDACAACADGAAHTAARAWMAEHYALRFVPSLLAAMARLFEVCRTRGLALPAQVVWGTHDPLGTLDQGLWSYRILAAKQRAVHFHAINRAGSLVFRDAPEAFFQVVAAFRESA